MFYVPFLGLGIVHELLIIQRFVNSFFKEIFNSCQSKILRSLYSYQAYLKIKSGTFHYFFLPYFLFFAIFKMIPQLQILTDSIEGKVLYIIYI